MLDNSFRRVSNIAIVATMSICLLLVYMVAITRGVPVLGVETEADPFATIAKILQGGMIGIAVFLIPSIVRVPQKMSQINRWR
jgi:hypothetical protein